MNAGILERDDARIDRTLIIVGTLPPGGRTAFPIRPSAVAPGGNGTLGLLPLPGHAGFSCGPPDRIARSRRCAASHPRTSLSHSAANSTCATRAIMGAMMRMNACCYSWVR